ncbi:catalase [Ktedonosporobacter rubrisoli]|uniref:Catalase n=1 Tax=Ktedonosporobacter rubrisoli TaxID=2509675 RepID=A0A4P6JHX7_KTERU|nr:catalase [Ktedonosporobacter rubrisoli]QBD74649.1 catalase [Ktedonosporobacter rubrisoli]
MSDQSQLNENSKKQSLDTVRENAEKQYLTTNQGVRIPHTDDSLKAGERGPTLLEDFHLREKIMHFDHERIPERVVHARGAGAYGYFQVYESMAEYTRASFLQNPAEKTPVFVRFSTVVGSRGSADTVRDVRGFATKFYTSDGVFDLVGNNFPIFFIQDAIKFPDLVHAVKPEPDNEMPQAATAHDTAWDFFSLLPEATHMTMWLLSDRALPRSFRMMEGFGVHTFRFINAQGRARFVKFHWKPALGAHSMTWDETQKMAGQDPDWLRRDLWEAIEMGDYPEYELGVQLFEESDEFAFPFDILDATKIIPEELVPVRRIGKLTLNRNPDNFFAETEQVAFHPGHVVSGIDFTNDPLLQGRLFSYLDTQLIRLGGPNFAEIPVNRPLAPVHNNQRDGYMRQTINTEKASYFPNSLSQGCPMLAPESAHGYVHYSEKINAPTVRTRSDSFKDYFSQATLFWKSLSPAEQDHLVAAAHFELGKVESRAIRERMVGLYAHVDHDLARRIAEGIGVNIPQDNPRPGVLPPQGRRSVERSAALSLENSAKNSIKSRRIAILAADGVDEGTIQNIKKALEERGAHTTLIAPRLGTIKGKSGQELAVDQSSPTTSSIMYDAVFIPNGQQGIDQLLKQGSARHFVAEAYKHGKAIAAIGEGIELLKQVDIPNLSLSGTSSNGTLVNAAGVITAQKTSDFQALAEQFAQAIAQHRHWTRQEELVPA